MWSFDVTLVCLLVLLALFFILTVYNVVQANKDLFHIGAVPFWSATLLDTATAANLFVAVLGALLVRHQFAVNLVPRIDYKSASAQRTGAENKDEVFETWRVEILNTGLGSAIIKHVGYFLEIQGAKNDDRLHPFSDVIKSLSATRLTRGKDYWIENITKGFSLSPKDICPVFEIKAEYLKTLRQLVMVLYFQGQLGHKYRSEIFLTPRF